MIRAGPPASSPEDAFTCGLLHEIGFLFFLQHYPAEYLNVIGRAGNSCSLIPEERLAFGISHPEVGQLIAEKWKLPEDLTAAIGNHHSFGFAGSKQLDNILRLAVALNREYFIQTEEDLEEKITRISAISDRLGVNAQQLDDRPFVVPNYDTYFFEVETKKGIKMLYDLKRGEYGSLIISSCLFPRYKIGDLIRCAGGNYYSVIGRERRLARLRYLFSRLSNLGFK